MKGIRFYEEFEDKKRGVSCGTVVAILTDAWRGDSDGRVYDALGGLYNEPNSPVASTSAHEVYLRKMCKRVSEARAREIHPNLLSRLEDD